jgi:hypothetical protein
MKKFLLIGSYLSIVIIILIPYANVVGYQYISPDAKELSPLFDIRIQRAIDADSKDITYEYLGRGEENSILFPTRNREESLIYRVIKIIKNEDSEWLIGKIQHINPIVLYKDMNYRNLQGLISKLHNILQKNEEIINNLETDLNNPIIKPFTIYRPLYILILLIFLLIFGLYIPIMSLYAGVTCDPCCFIYDPKTFRI